MRCLATPGNTIDSRIEALAEMAANPDTSSMLPRGMMSLCHPRTAPTGYDAIRLALLWEVERGPTIGRKRRRRRARGRARGQR